MSTKVIFYTAVVLMTAVSALALKSVLDKDDETSLANATHKPISSLSLKLTHDAIPSKTLSSSKSAIQLKNENSKESTLISDSITEDSSNIVANRLRDQSEDFVTELLDVVGDGGVLPITDKDAQNRLLNKIRTEKQKRILSDYNKAEYDPSYDATWSNDIQTTALNELDAYFPDGTYIESYECSSNSRCNLKLAGLGSQRTFGREASEFMYALRDTPAIIKSGATRDVFLSSINFDENGQSIVELVIAKNELIADLGTIKNDAQ